MRLPPFCNWPTFLCPFLTASWHCDKNSCFLVFRWLKLVRLIVHSCWFVFSQVISSILWKWWVIHQSWKINLLCCKLMLVKFYTYRLNRELTSNLDFSLYYDFILSVLFFYIYIYIFTWVSFWFFFFQRKERNMGVVLFVLIRLEVAAKGKCYQVVLFL